MCPATHDLLPAICYGLRQIGRAAQNVQSNCGRWQAAHRHSSTAPAALPGASPLQPHFLSCVHRMFVPPQASKAADHAGCIAAQALAADREFVHAVCFRALGASQVSIIFHVSSFEAGGAILQDVGSFCAMPGAGNAPFQRLYWGRRACQLLRRLPSSWRLCGRAASTCQPCAGESWSAAHTRHGQDGKEMAT